MAVFRDCGGKAESEGQPYHHNPEGCGLSLSSDENLLNLVLVLSPDGSIVDL